MRHASLDMCLPDRAEDTPPDDQTGESPHEAFIKTYVDKVAARDLNVPPHRSVIVKENYSPDKKLMAITVMQRSTGYDPEHGDWYYAKFTSEGKIATTPPEMKTRRRRRVFRSNGS